MSAQVVILSCRNDQLFLLKYVLLSLSLIRGTVIPKEGTCINICQFQCCKLRNDGRKQKPINFALFLELWLKNFRIKFQVKGQWSFKMFLFCKVRNTSRNCFMHFAEKFIGWNVQMSKLHTQETACGFSAGAVAAASQPLFVRSKKYTQYYHKKHTGWFLKHILDLHFSQSWMRILKLITTKMLNLNL